MNGKEKAERHSPLTMPFCGNTITSLWACAFPMKDYAHMEKFGSFGVQLPTNDERITTEAGDVILSEGNLLVLYYAPNTWNFTRLGRVRNLSEAELRAVLGKGDITATLTLSDEDDIGISAHSGKI